MKNIIRSSTISGHPGQKVRHPLYENGECRVVPLGDMAGMTRAMMHLIRLAPGKETTPPHTHALQEEFVYILEGRGEARLGDETAEVGPGDFIGYPTDSAAHNIRNIGETDLVYLTGGERTSTEIAHFPTLGKVIHFKDGQAQILDGAGARTIPTTDWMIQD